MMWASIARRCASGCARPRRTPAAGPGAVSASEREELAELRREVKELRKANEILKAASVFFAKELDPTRPR